MSSGGLLQLVAYGAQDTVTNKCYNTLTNTNKLHELTPQLKSMLYKYNHEIDIIENNNSYKITYNNMYFIFTITNYDLIMKLNTMPQVIFNNIKNIVEKYYAIMNEKNCCVCLGESTIKQQSILCLTCNEGICKTCFTKIHKAENYSCPICRSTNKYVECGSFHAETVGQNSSTIAINNETTLRSSQREDTAYRYIDIWPTRSSQRDDTMSPPRSGQRDHTISPTRSSHRDDTPQDDTISPTRSSQRYNTPQDNTISSTRRSQKEDTAHHRSRPIRYNYNDPTMYYFMEAVDDSDGHYDPSWYYFMGSDDSDNYNFPFSR